MIDYESELVLPDCYKSKCIHVFIQIKNLSLFPFPQFFNGRLIMNGIEQHLLLQAHLSYSFYQCEMRRET